VLKKITISIFSICVWFLAAVWIAVWLGVGYIAAFFYDRPRVRQFCTRQGALALRFTGCRLKVHYHPLFNPKKQSVYCKTHTSLLDGFVAARVIKSPFTGVMQSWQFKVPLYGWWQTYTRGIGVSADTPNDLAAVMANLQDRKSQGLSILVFPEGQRTSDGNVGRFRLGAFRWAQQLALPIVPIAVRGLYKVNNVHTWRFRPGRVEVCIGPNIPISHLSTQALHQFIRELNLVVAEYVKDGDCDLFHIKTTKLREKILTEV